MERRGAARPEDGGGTISLERQVRIAAGSLVLLGVVLAATADPYAILLSAFVGAGLVFSGVTDTCGLDLMLARAPSNTRRDAGRRRDLHLKERPIRSRT